VAGIGRTGQRRPLGAAASNVTFERFIIVAREQAVMLQRHSGTPHALAD